MCIIPIVDDGHHSEVNQFLSALGEQLQAQRSPVIEIVVIGGSALIAVGLVNRATRDVDVVAVLRSGGLQKPQPLPEPLAIACARIARDFGLPDNWLNTGPAGLLDFGLPDGFVGRLESHDYGPALRVYFASRFDQIHFKLYAMADGMAGKHEVDLRALEPTEDELLTAARWTLTHDPSDGFRSLLLQALEALGVQDADLSA
jgi:hypothetical protein